MTRRPFLTFALLALSSFPSSLASITRDQLLLDPWQNYADPFNLTFTISDDLTLNVDISTVKTAPDSLIAIGGGANDSMANRELTVSAGFHNTGPISEFLMGDWDVKGNLVVTEGLTAKVDMAAYWGFDGSDEARVLHRVVDLTGPFAKDYVGHMNSTQGTRPGYCSGLDPGVKTFSTGFIGFRFLFQFDKMINTSATAKGRMGEKNEHAISLHSKMTVKEGCSRTNLICIQDRTNFTLCQQYS